jgi:hypothetical protein
VFAASYYTRKENPMNKLQKRNTSNPPALTFGVWSILGGVAAVALAVVVAKSFPSIRRYIKIERM